MRNKSGVTIAFVLFSLSVPVSVHAVTGLKWTQCADIPEPRVGGAVAVIGTQIYVLGGRADLNLGDYNTVWAYDTVNNTWTSKTAVGSSLMWPYGCALNGLIYLNTAFAVGWLSYDPTPGTTSTKANKPYDGTGSAIAVGSYVYVMGGEWSFRVNNLARYDPGSNAWTGLQPMPIVRSNMSAVVLDGNICVIGGRDNTQDAGKRVDIYNPGTDVWTNKRNMLAGRGDRPTAGVLNGKIYVASGSLNTASLFAESYDPASDTWSAVPNSPETGCGWRFDSASAVVGNTLYVISGYNTGYTIASVWKAWVEDIPVQSSTSLDQSSNSQGNIPSIPSSVYPSTGKMKILNNIIRGQGGVAYCLISGAPFTGFTVKIISQGGLLYGTYDGTTGADGKAVVPIYGRTALYSGQSSDLRSGMYWVYANSNSGNSIRCRKPIVVVNEQ
jgi:hypothetical protein